MPSPQDPLPGLDDDKLIKSCLAGNENHFRVLYLRYEKLVASLIWSMIRDRDALPDLTQQVFIKAFRGLRGFKGESSFKTWLCRITKNLCLDHLKKAKKNPELQNDMLESKADDHGDCNERPLGDPHGSLLEKERQMHIGKALNELSSEHRQSLTLSQEGCTYAEIAELTETSIKTVGSRIFYAKEQLRKKLRPYFKEGKI